MKNELIVKILNNIADILELQEVKFKPQAYRRAALSIEELSEDVGEVYKRGELGELPGVGKSIAEKIEEIIKTGKLKYYEQLKREINILIVDDIRKIDKSLIKKSYNGFVLCGGF